MSACTKRVDCVCVTCVAEADRIELLIATEPLRGHLEAAEQICGRIAESAEDLMMLRQFFRTVRQHLIAAKSELSK